MTGGVVVVADVRLSVEKWWRRVSTARFWAGSSSSFCKSTSLFFLALPCLVLHHPTLSVTPCIFDLKWSACTATAGFLRGWMGGIWCGAFGERRERVLWGSSRKRPSSSRTFSLTGAYTHPECASIASCVAVFLRPPQRVFGEVVGVECRVSRRVCVSMALLPSPRPSVRNGGLPRFVPSLSSSCSPCCLPSASHSPQLRIRLRELRPRRPPLDRSRRPLRAPHYQHLVRQPRLLILPRLLRRTPVRHGRRQHHRHHELSLLRTSPPSLSSTRPVRRTRGARRRRSSFELPPPRSPLHPCPSPSSPSLPSPPSPRWSSPSLPSSSLPSPSHSASLSSPPTSPALVFPPPSLFSPTSLPLPSEPSPLLPRYYPLSAPSASLLTLLSTFLAHISLAPPSFYTLPSLASHPLRPHPPPALTSHPPPSFLLPLPPFVTSLLYPHPWLSTPRFLFLLLSPFPLHSLATPRFLSIPTPSSPPLPSPSLPDPHARLLSRLLPHIHPPRSPSPSPSPLPNPSLLTPRSASPRSTRKPPAPTLPSLVPHPIPSC
ncbi:hypothetical protein B0H12DRAFT_273970 [Mycena haematopus]|nr:hypothetical protein B0H12DRAFT_273970 [Mycena haematopus]